MIIYRFGAFELDPASRRLTRGTERVRLTDPQSSLLLCLVSRAPDIVDRQDLGTAGWGGAASPASIEKAISQLRKGLGDDGTAFVETIPNRGYRFVAPIEQLEPLTSIAMAAPDEEPFRDFVQGRRELATLKPDAIEDARDSFERTIRHAPDYAPAHTGLAMASALLFEATRLDTRCAVNSLARAIDHARRATLLDPVLADAWSTLGFARYLTGETDAASIAARKAVALDPARWHHWLRLAYVTWGEERIEAARTALTLRPDLAFAHWLTSTVLIARGALDAALMYVRAGCAAQDKQRTISGAYPAVGLHLLHGLVLAAQDRLDAAALEFNEELAEPRQRHVYSRECAANTWYALGALHLRRRAIPDATAAFRRALEIAPGHFAAMAALGLPLPVLAPGDPRVVDAAIAHSIALTRAGRHRDAAEHYRGILITARASNAGWILPVEPTLCATARPEVWSDALTLATDRAT